MSQPVGIVTFFSSQHAIQGESVLKSMGFQVELVPGPKDISPNCGVALQCPLPDLAAAETALRENGVKYEAGHRYAPSRPKSLLQKLLGG